MSLDSCGYACVLIPDRATANPRYSSVRQVDAVIVPDLDAGRDDNLPWMPIGIGKISRVSTVIGAVCRLQQLRALR